MNGLAISLFGKFDAQFDNRPLKGMDGAKVQELFCYLLLFRGKPHSRETLATLLWNDAAQARKYLRKALWQLQTSLDGGKDGVGKDLLRVEPEWIELNVKRDTLKCDTLKTNIWVDAVVLETAFGQAQGIQGKKLSADQYKSLSEAAELYQGDLLESCYADWCLLERERYRYMYLALVDKLMAYCEVHQQIDAGISYGNLALGHDLARERTHRRLMRLFFLGGYRTEALRQYERCVNALRRELDVEPIQDTRLLYEQIRMGSDQVKLTADRASVQGDPLSLDRIKSQIQEAQQILADAQRRIQQDLDSERRSRVNR